MFAIAALVALAAQAQTAAQSARPAASSNNAAGSGFTPSKTPWGDPDLQGMWLPGGGQRMETPAGKPWEGRSNSGAGAAFSDFFDPNRGSGAPARPRTPDPVMVVDPPDGRIPLQPWAVTKRGEIVAHPEKIENLDPRVRCLQSGVPRAHLPVGYNTYQ